MFVNIRNSVFETNSSSAHSIVVCKEGTVTKPRDIVLVDGAWNIVKTHDLDFGRQFELLTTEAEKACFAIASLKSDCPYYKKGKKSLHDSFDKKNENLLKNILHILQKVYPSMTDILVPLEKESEYFVQGVGRVPEGRLCYKYDNEKDKSYRVFVQEDDTEIMAIPTGKKVFVPYYGDIDHQSIGLLHSFLNRQNVSLQDFILDSRYVVVIDSDEILTFDDIAKSGILDMDAIQMVDGFYEEETDNEMEDEEYETHDSDF